MLVPSFLVCVRLGARSTCCCCCCCCRAFWLQTWPRLPRRITVSLETAQVGALTTMMDAGNLLLPTFGRAFRGVQLNSTTIGAFRSHCLFICLRLQLVNLRIEPWPTIKTKTDRHQPLTRDMNSLSRLETRVSRPQAG